MATGNLNEVKQALRRHRDGLRDLLRLEEIPDLSASSGDLERLEKERTEPLAGEKVTVWAIQADQDVQTRQALPSWVSGPIQRASARWLEEHKVWQTKIAQRAAEGKELTDRMSTQFEAWKQEKREIRLLFNREKKSLVTSIRKNADVSKMRKQLFSLEISMSPDPSQVQVRAGSGKAFQLVVLQGAALHDSPVPAELDQGLAPGALQLQEPEVESGGESDENMEARDGLMDEQEALQVEEAAILEDDDVEVLGFSDEEENMQSMMEGTGFIRVKNFNHREAYRKLQSLNLTLLPQGGIHLSYHCSTRTWTGYYPEVKAKELCFTHGGRTLRTEAESLLLVIRNLLKLHTERFPRDALWRGQYQKVLDALATQAYL